MSLLCAGVHLAHERRGAGRGGGGAHALRQLRGVEPGAPRRAGVRQRRLLAAPVGAQGGRRAARAARRRRRRRALLVTGTYASRLLYRVNRHPNKKR